MYQEHTFTDFHLYFVTKEQIEKDSELNSQFREQMEQERRDHELALRLAQETNGQVEELSPPTRRYTLTHYCVEIILMYTC